MKPILGLSLVLNVVCGVSVLVLWRAQDAADERMSAISSIATEAKNKADDLVASTRQTDMRVARLINTATELTNSLWTVIVLDDNARGDRHFELSRAFREQYQIFRDKEDPRTTVLRR